MTAQEIKEFKDQTKAAMKKAENSYAAKSPEQKQEIDARAKRIADKTLSQIG